MKRQPLIAIIASLLIVVILVHYSYFINDPVDREPADVYVGIDVAYDDIPAIKELVNKVKSYTNLFVIGCTGITYDQYKLQETCQYLYNSNMYFIIYASYMSQSTEWVEAAKKTWGDHFMGFYAFDEVGGHQLDQVSIMVNKADNYTDASNKFVDHMSSRLNRFFIDKYPSSVNPTLFTSDYALYWFDYKAGYDVLLAQFGWNYSRQLNVALCRGAAAVQNKSWGVMITWTYNNPPYIESREELYNDLVYAYENGAEYILVFDSNENYTQGILEDEHLDALKQFWTYIQDNPRDVQLQNDRVAYVLPADYGYGFRGPSDKIWGLWESDTFSYDLCVHLNSFLEQYGARADIIYDDGLETGNISIYSKLVFWNGTIIDK